MGFCSAYPSSRINIKLHTINIPLSLSPDQTAIEAREKISWSFPDLLFCFEALYKHGKEKGFPPHAEMLKKSITFFQVMVHWLTHERRPISCPITPDPDSHQDTQTIRPPALVCFFWVYISLHTSWKSTAGTPRATLITLSECVRLSLLAKKVKRTLDVLGKRTMLYIWLQLKSNCNWYISESAYSNRKEKSRNVAGFISRRNRQQWYARIEKFFVLSWATARDNAMMHLEMNTPNRSELKAYILETR